MWPRVVEVMLGLWLLVSPFIFHRDNLEPLWLATELAGGSLVIAFSLFSFWKKTRRAHLLSLAVAGWLFFYGYFGEPYPTPAALQNFVTMGLIIAMMAIIPTEAVQPPVAWRRYYQAR